MELYTLKEAAKILKISTQTIRRMIIHGEIEAHKVRGQWRIRKDTVDRLMGIGN